MSVLQLAQPVIARLPRPQLHLVREAVPRMSAAAFTTLVIGIMGGGLLGMLVINNAIAQGAFVEARLAGDVKVIEASMQSMQQSLSLMASPGNVEERARAMGMVPQASPVFLRLSDGKVLGDPTPAERDDVPTTTRLLAPQTSVLAPDLQVASAVIKARPMIITSDAAVALTESTP